MPKHDRAQEPQKEKQKEESDLLELRKMEPAPDCKERPDATNGLSRFKKETGVDFLDLLNDPQHRSKTLADSAKKHDTDDDERENQHLYDPLQKKLISE